MRLECLTAQGNGYLKALLPAELPSTHPPVPCETLHSCSLLTAHCSQLSTALEAPDKSTAAGTMEHALSMRSYEESPYGFEKNTVTHVVCFDYTQTIHGLECTIVQHSAQLLLVDNRSDMPKEAGGVSLVPWGAMTNEAGVFSHWTRR